MANGAGVGSGVGRLRSEPRTPLRNVWLGVSVEDQQRADLRIPALLDTPATVRWLSCEPLLGPVTLSEWLVTDGHHKLPLPGLHWVVASGESGPGARLAHPDWFRALRDQCQNAEVPFFFKQWGDHLPVEVFDAPSFAGGRAFHHPRGGTSAATIRKRSTGSFRSGVSRPMRPGDVNGYGQLLDADTLALRVGKTATGRALDGREWTDYPQMASAGSP